MRRKGRILSAVMAMCFALAAFPVAPQAAGNGNNGNDDDYSLVWSDEFNGTELNRNDWNVELHDAGWVNSELQEYVDSTDNIKVQDGKLYIYPQKILAPGGYQSIADVSSLNNEYDATSVTSNEWDVQGLCEGLSLSAGKTYYVCFDAKSTAGRTIAAGVQKRSGDYKTYGQLYPWLTNDVQHFSYVFTMTEDDNNAGIFFSVGRTSNEIAAAKITISNVAIFEVPEVATSAVGPEEWQKLEGWHGTAGQLGDQKYSFQRAVKTTYEANHSYKVVFKASSTEARPIAVEAAEYGAPYTWFGGSEFNIGTELKEYSFEFKMGANAPTDASLKFNMGQFGGTPESTIQIADVKIYDITGTPATITKYTSGRISTQNKQTFTYGKFEARVKVPAGQGYLPAFWLMSNDESVYGQWPRCGEIDCMEVMGQDPTKVYGTIHYGNPHSESQGTKVVTGPNFAEDFHTFTCEWEPGKITWYVDGIKYHEESDWYSTTEGQGTLSYPAPFDSPFYVILNLAVGGSWVGNPDSTTNFVDNPFVVDYVKVYQKSDYNEDVTKPEKPFVPNNQGDNEGNYIVNGDFSVAEDLTDTTDWVFMVPSDKEGSATATINNNKIDIITTAAGTVDYSVQLVQANIPFVKGATYEVKFDAYADSPRTMNVDVKAPDRGYQPYMPTFKPEITTENQTFKTTFTMKSDSDANGRLEFNMGAGSIAGLHITNVSVKKIADPDPNAIPEKPVLADGNFIYNGKFQEGIRHLGYWDVSSPNNAYVTGYSDGRRLKVSVAEGSDYVTVSQDNLTFTEGTQYAFSFEAQTEKDANVRVVIGGKKYKVPVTAGEKKTYTIYIPDSAEFTDKKVTFKFEAGSTVLIDNVMLAEDSLIKNGNFDANMTGYETYVADDASATFSVEEVDGSSALKVEIPAGMPLNDEDWKIQLKQNNVPLIEGHTYVLKAKVKSTEKRPVRIIMQGHIGNTYPVYSGASTGAGAYEWVVAGPDGYAQFEETFKMTATSDPAAFLSICFGDCGDVPSDNGIMLLALNDYRTMDHTVYIKEISLVDLNAGDSKDFNKYIDNDPDKSPVKPDPVKPNNKPANVTPNADIKKDLDTAPKTGDNTPLAATAAIMLLAGAAFVILKKRLDI